MWAHVQRMNLKAVTWVMWRYINILIIIYAVLHKFCIFIITYYLQCFKVCWSLWLKTSAPGHLYSKLFFWLNKQKNNCMTTSCYIWNIFKSWQLHWISTIHGKVEFKICWSLVSSLILILQLVKTSVTLL